jgi:hypothetical protein
MFKNTVELAPNMDPKSRRFWSGIKFWGEVIRIRIHSTVGYGTCLYGFFINNFYK